MRATSVWVLSALLMLIAAGAVAQVDGRVEGAVTAEDGSPLAGATVKATSPVLIGERIVTSDERGLFRFVNLPPGLYEITSTLEGFATVQSKDVKVGIDQTVRLSLAMRPAFSGEIEVTGETPVLDVTKATSGVSVTPEDVVKLPLPRDFYGVAQITTGSARDAVGTTFYGSTGAITLNFNSHLNVTGALAQQPGATLRLVSNSGSTAAAGAMTNSGKATIGSGDALTVGTFAQNANGTLATEVGGAGAFGALHVNAGARLDGRFEANLVNGYSPSVGDSFAPVTFAAATGAFTTWQLANNSWYAFHPTLSAAALGVTAVSPAQPTTRPGGTRRAGGWCSSVTSATAARTAPP